VPSQSERGLQIMPRLSPLQTVGAAPKPSTRLCDAAPLASAPDPPAGSNSSP